jgi:Ca2+-binding EF-hand superfamily protein
MQQRLKDHVLTRKLLGAINSLAALRNMQLAEVDWDRIHRIMRKMALGCLSKIKLDPSREAELREGFGLLDRDNTGKISLSNLEDSMRALGHLRSQEQVDFMMKRFDLYQTGDISFEEYCVMMSVPPGLRRLSEAQQLSDEQEKKLLDQYLSDLQKNELLESLKAFDLDGSGFIDSQNIKKLFSLLGSSLTEREKEYLLVRSSVTSTDEEARKLVYRRKGC